MDNSIDREPSGRLALETVERMTHGAGRVTSRTPYTGVDTPPDRPMRVFSGVKRDNRILDRNWKNQRPKGRGAGSVLGLGHFRSHRPTASPVLFRVSYSCSKNCFPPKIFLSDSLGRLAVLDVTSLALFSNAYFLSPPTNPGPSLVAQAHNARARFIAYTFWPVRYLYRT